MIKRNVLVTLTLLSLQPVAAHGATYTVTNTNDSGAGSLREAINDANSNAGTDTIAFNIAGAGVHTIFPSTPLPWLIGTTSVDGSTQPGFAGTPLIEIAGDFAGVGAVGLQIFNNSSQVGWLTINGFDSHGIRISGSGNATIVGCFIGVTNTGLASSFPNKGNGVFIDNSPNNNIGGTVASLRNIISANRLSGVRIEGASSTGNNVRGNYIGTNVNGTLELFNGPDGGGCGFEAGVAIIDAQNNTIGGPLSGYRNVISANRCDNIYISNGDGTLIQGNYVGLTASGSALVPLNPTNDTQRNIAVGSHNVTIGGTSVSHRNVIASANVGIILFGNNCTVQGNYIGTDATGSYALYTGIGVRIYGSDNNLIGGGVPGAGNVISGNAQGVSLIFDAGAGGMNRIQRNYIGLDASGLVAIPNIWGIIIDDTSSGNMIGGSLTSYRNFISGNSGHGISFGWLGGTATPSYNWVIGNYIGLDKNTQALGNGGSGIHFNVTAGAIGNKIGDSTIGGRNHIRYNGEAGISILTPATGTRISDNIIDDNFGLGIDLGGFGGVTPNDANDLDAGGNNQQNYPVFTSAVGDGQVWGSGTITVGGSLDSTPNTTFRIELYAIEACDSSGYGEGLGFLGFFDVTTNAGGDVTFSQLVINTRTFGLDWFLSATARNLTTDDTSEFSVCIPIG
ncbi:MAG: hypothetical protein O7G85_02765 [Planctomycetota bacterium]|nr:hypothetical protein [Planctomycetota bacterium]